MNVTRLAAFLVVMALSLPVRAQTPAQTPTDAQGPSTTPPPITMKTDVQVTATRFGEPVAEVPGAISIVTGDELRARGATDLRMALALLGGVSVAPGGDAGPAAAVPGLLGVREVDDLLVLVDGIPAGGAFIPQIEAITLTNVERIEVLRGAAPVYFGTTAFAGTINVIHYSAGSADRTASFRFGSYQSGAIGGAAVLSSGRVRQSVSAELSQDHMSDERADHGRTQAAWRLSAPLGQGRFGADVDVMALRQKPNSPVPIDETTGEFYAPFPVDYNQNPANAKLDTNRYKAVLEYDVPLSFGRWGNTAAYTHTDTDSIRGFLDIEDTPQPWTPTTNADLESFEQALTLRELFADSNLTTRMSSRADLTTGVNLLFGRAGADSLRYGQRLLLDGISQVPGTDTTSPKGGVDFDDHRRFVGVYAQSRYQATTNVSLLGGLRWNSTHEIRDERRVNSRGVRTDSHAEQDVNRLTGSAGAAWHLWQKASGPIAAITVHGSAGYTFQPAQIDFGPDPEAKPEGGGLLEPETTRSVIGGLRADAPGGIAGFDISAFFVDFYNQPVAATSGGVGVLRSIGRQRYKGIDFEGTLEPRHGLIVRGNAGWSDARYRDYLTEIDGQPVQLAGFRQVLTPAVRAGGGILYAVEHGWRGSLTVQWTGEHFLDSENDVEAPAYALVDASLGYHFKRVTISLVGSNLGNRRDAVQLSELGEGQFYRMPARRIDATLTWHYR